MVPVAALSLQESTNILPVRRRFSLLPPSVLPLPPPPNQAQASRSKNKGKAPRPGGFPTRTLYKSHREIKTTLCVREKARFSPSFSAHTAPRHLTCYHGRWRKSGLQISLGDFVSFSPLCCVFGVPELFFWLFVGSPVHSSLIASIWTPYALHPIKHICPSPGWRQRKGTASAAGGPPSQSPRPPLP